VRKQIKVYTVQGTFKNIPEEVADTVRTVHLYLNPVLEGSGSEIVDDILSPQLGAHCRCQFTGA
jgi:hypothetical protein